MVYSPFLDAAFCIQCAVMVPHQQRSQKGAFVNKPFVQFHKLDEKAKDHQKTKYHCESMIAAEHLEHSVLKPEQNIHIRLDKQRQQNIERNRHIIKSVAEVILFCGRQCIALRGDQEYTCDAFEKKGLEAEGRENADKGQEIASGNPGNFIAALQMLAEHDEVLRQHLYSIGLHNKNAKYTSPRIQNEMIEIIGHDIICNKLTEEIRAAKYFSIMKLQVTTKNNSLYVSDLWMVTKMSGKSFWLSFMCQGLLVRRLPKLS